VVLDELRVYSHSVAGALNAAFEYIANAEFFGHLCSFYWSGNPS